jgi:hypothetical protein
MPLDVFATKTGPSNCCCQFVRTRVSVRASLLDLKNRGLASGFQRALQLDLWQFEFSITCVQSTQGHRSKSERPQAVYKSEGNASCEVCITRMLQTQ